LGLISESGWSNEVDRKVAVEENEEHFCRYSSECTNSSLWILMLAKLGFLPEWDPALVLRSEALRKQSYWRIGSTIDKYRN
jgi:hypothetical protein